MSAVFPIDPDARWRSYTASAAQTAFSIPFPFQDDDDITVLKVALDGAVTTLANPADYTVAGAGNPAGGSFTLVTGAAAGEKFRPIGSAVLERVMSIVRGGKYKSSATDSDLDRLMIIAQEARRDIDRAWKASYGTAGGAIFAGSGDELAAFDENGDLRSIGVTAAMVEGYRDFAHKWASEAEDVSVDDGTNPPGFSAFHWSRKAFSYLSTTVAQAAIAAAQAGIATAQAVIAAAQAAAAAASQVATAADRVQTGADRIAAAASAAAAAGSAGISRTYATHAVAVADVANIPANAFVQVLVDEDHLGHRTMYQKQAGVLVFILDFDAGRGLSPESFGAIAYATRTLAIAGTDSSVAFDNLFAAWYAAGGATIRLNGWYRVAKAYQLANTNTLTTIGTQPSLKFSGIGGHATAGRPEGGSGIVWTAETGAPIAKLTTLGRGLLVLEDCIFASAPASGNTKPFIHTTFTTIKTGTGFAFDGAVSGAGAAEDGFILGGQTDHEGNPSFDRRDPDCGFQGYGTVIDKVYCNGIRRLAVPQRYANGIRITNNTIWNTCGNNSATGGAIEIDGAPIAPTGYATSIVIANNLIEATNYKYGIRLKNTNTPILHGNDFYDPGAGTVAGILIDATCLITRIIAGYGATKPYVVDNSGRAVIFGAEPSFYDVMNSIKAGSSGYPNTLGATVFNDPIGTVFQALVASGNNKLLTVKRSAADVTDTGVEVFSITGAGAINLGNLSQAGNIINGLSTGASFSSNMKTWGFPGATGSSMTQNSGTGGSVFTMQNANVQFKDQSGALQGKWSGSAGSGLGIGIDFGSAGDATFYKGSTAYLGVNVPFKLKSYTAATLPAAASVGGAGSLAYVSDANAVTARSTVAGGGANKVLVFSDGTNWLIAA